jgi:hypothetical protein
MAILVRGAWGREYIPELAMDDMYAGHIIKSFDC